MHTVSAGPLCPVLAVLGPTGSGKSDLALQLAASLNGEIVNFDSVQVYRGLDIGSAKLPARERCGIVHHLLDVVDPAEDFTAGAYMRMARRILADVTSRGKLAILVGGTGFYLRALLDGLSPAPLRNEQLRGRLAQRRSNVLHRYLRRLDPVSAERIHPNDTPKLIRAIELSLESGRPASAVQARARDKLQGYRVLKIGLAPARERLRSRLDHRSALLFERGLVEETRRLLAEGVPPTAKSMQSLGYKQAVALLQGALTLPEAIAECQARTRQYAKRQMTWFRADPDVVWLHGFGQEEWVHQNALALASGWNQRACSPQVACPLPSPG